jgi:hypothetical protein
VGPNPNEIYCTTARNFTRDLHQAPVVAIVPPQHAKAAQSDLVHFTLSKVATVTLALDANGTSIRETRQLLGHGSHTLRWRAPNAGNWKLSITAVDLAGNHSEQFTGVAVAAAVHLRSAAKRQGQIAAPPQQ